MLELENWSGWHGNRIVASHGKIVVVHRMVVVGHGMYGDLKTILASASFGFVGR